MINSQLSIYYLTRGDTERVKRDSFSSKGGESKSSYGNSAECFTQNHLSLDRSIKHGLSRSDTNDKPSHSFIAMISMAILSKPNKKILLNDIYQYIMDNFPFYNNKEKAWRNSIRHNLSLNECFVKSGRSVNGKVNYWSIHQGFISDFARGDFRRRNARRRARKSSVKTADSLSNQFYTRNNNEYVPMTLSQIAISSYTMKGSLMHTNLHNPHHINQSSDSKFGMTSMQFPAVMQSFGIDSSVPVSQSSSGGLLFNVQSKYCTSSSFRPSSNSACQIQK
ncbi:unnamed protein product [Mytilus coruscus]|uniref:Fork-head domain-containing protein n=1 Tax=Mytilus coruscus TaxID=42192 RepID=A0A6J8EHF5_MYTCO|nr:unnamed protein product [Mytilus coruscus]